MENMNRVNGIKGTPKLYFYNKRKWHVLPITR